MTAKNFGHYTTLRTVSVGWYDGGWSVIAGSVEYPSSWDDGSQVFSRNSVLESSEHSETLSPSDALSLAIETVKKAGYKIYKEI